MAQAANKKRFEISHHAAARAAERNFPPAFMSVVESAAGALEGDLMDALNRACGMKILSGQQFALKVSGRRFTVDFSTGVPQVATEMVLGTHCVVIGMDTHCVPTLVTIKPAETHLKRQLKASRRKAFREVEED